MKLKAGQNAPNFIGESMRGEKVSLDVFRGRFFYFILFHCVSVYGRTLTMN